MTWPSTGQELQLPVDAGATAERVAWLYYADGYAPPRIVWINVADGQVAGNVRYLQIQSRIVAVGSGAVVYVCGTSGTGTLCLAYQPGLGEPVWQAPLGRNGMVIGGALVPGRLYVTTDSGMLLAVGHVASEGPAAKPAERTPVPTWTLPFQGQSPTPLP